MEPLRLNKRLAQAGVASRRGADELVAAGKVLINGKVAESPGLRVGPEDVIQVDGRTLPPMTPPAHRHILLHKPVEVVTTVRDPQGRRTVLDCLPADLVSRTRLYPVGRLDYFSEGLLLLTDDGDLAHRLMHPRHHLPKIYEVLVRGEVSAEALAAIRQGMTLPDGERVAPAKARILGIREGRTRLELILEQGVNRQIRRMAEGLGLTILRLARVGQGSLRLGDLPPGGWRELTSEELARLREETGLESPTSSPASRP